jgi:protein-tyrosine phosphatase
VIDLHAHILPGLDDGAQTWEESLEMARMAVADGITVMVATPHLYQGRSPDPEWVNTKEVILECLAQFRQKLAGERIPLEVLPGCDFPLGFESLQLLEQGLALTLNDAQRYLLLELPDTALPPALEDICFQLQSRCLTPIITHPERHVLIQERPEKLARLIDLGCLVQLTASSLTGGFGRRVKKIARQMVKAGYVHLLATDTHSPHHRPPLLSPAVKELTRLAGEEQAQAMVTQIPAKIIQGTAIFS